MFEPVASKVNFPQLEEKVLRFWKEKNVFERSVNARKGGPRFVMFDGPPTANGSPGIHHVLARVFKDAIPRYRTMKGYYVPRIAGWDTHGLPVELEVEKKLGISNKNQIEAYGIAKFNAKCKESVFSYLKEWDTLTERIGYWIDLEHAYITMDNSYIESEWWAIKQMWEKDLIYQGYRVTPHCPRCGTSLSSHEVALGYKDDHEDPSVYVKFKAVLGSLTGSAARQRLAKLAASRPVYLLAWTTTPWTLPGNTAVAVAPGAEYAVAETEDGYLVLAAARLVATGLTENQVVDRLAGQELVDVRYEPLFNPHLFGVERLRFKQGATLEVQPPDEALTYRAVAGDFVSMEDGTGIVHIAPAYGEIDYGVGQQEGLDFIHVVDLQGKMTGSYPFAGKFVKTADKDILEDLKSRRLLYKAGTIRHTYPFCWRCDTPLLYYAKKSWYIRTTAAIKRLIEGNERINWYPEHIKEGRFGDWLKNNVDWAFSRERYWGTPLPVWRCEACGRLECIGGVDELRKKPGFSGFAEPLDLHRPYVDELTFACADCVGKMKRQPEVIDCWFDSGAMPIAQSHYPFENSTLLEDGRFPADYICEGVDQTRGWFYSLHAIATLLFDRPAYGNVICLGHILDAKGEKMSKSKGNVAVPATVISRHGADALRWYLLTSSPPGNVRRFAEESVAEVARRFFLTLWNVYSFFVTYANIDNYVPGAAGAAPQPSELDRWIISELNQLVLDVDNGLENYNPTDAGRRIETFVDDLSNWYVRRSRRRFWKSGSDADKMSAYNTLYHCLVTLTRLLAPFVPFLAEELYRNLVVAVSPQAPESVHLTDFPVADKGLIDERLSAAIRLAIKASSLGRAARSEAGIKVRQPLDHAFVSTAGPHEQEDLERLKPQILEEINVKELKYGTFAEVAALKDQGYSVSGLETEEGQEQKTSGRLVAVPTQISPELQVEGMAREVVRRLQTMRRAAGFEISDHIIIYYQGNDYLRQVIDTFAAYISQETLSDKLIEGQPEEGAHTEQFKLGGGDLTLGVKRS
jgi:isoleucyl-tRNA synthetase